MRFKSQQPDPSLPNIDLIPMLNVMMAVLAFFVLISMTLASAPEGLSVRLPRDGQEDSQPGASQPPPLRVQLKADRQIWLGEVPLADPSQLPAQVRAYLQENEAGAVWLMAEPEVSYEQVVRLLSSLREVGGDRVQLAIEGE